MDIRGKIALVTGANGFVGTRVCQHLSASGAVVRALVRRPGERTELLTGGIVEVEGSFLDPETMASAIRGAEIIVHCAATVGPDIETARRVNVEGTRVVLESARAAGSSPRIVHISSVSVYAGAGRETVDETTLLTTEGRPYAVTKAEADDVVLAAIGAGARATILRPGAILGAHPSSSWAVRMPRMIRERKITLAGNGTGTLPIVHVDDVCRAITLAITDERAAGRIYNVVDDHVSWRTYTDDVRAWFDTPPLDTVGTREGGVGEPDATYLAERIRAELGYAPTRSYADGMCEARLWWEARNDA